MRRLLRFSAFLLVPALSAVTPLIAIPAITATAGATGWEAYALGLAIGSAACTLVELGWPLTGPQRVAAELPGHRWVTLISSVRTRLLALIVLAPLAMGLAGVLTWNVSADYVATAVLMALASTTTGLSGNWYFIGVGRPLRILTADALPKAVLIVAASMAVLAGAPLEVVPAGYLLAATISPIASLLLARHERESVARFTLADDLRVIRLQRSAMGARSISALYIALPVTLVALFAPAALATFAAAERLMRMALTILQAVPNMLQNWLGSAISPAERRHRVLRSIALNSAIGLASGLAFTLVTPWASNLLFSGTVEVEWQLAALAGVVLALVCVSRATGSLALVRYGWVNAITASALAAAIVGVPMICLLAAIAGAAGAFVGEILAEVTAISVQVGALVVAMDRDRRPFDGGRHRAR